MIRLLTCFLFATLVAQAQLIQVDPKFEFSGTTVEINNYVLLVVFYDIHDNVHHIYGIKDVWFDRRNVYMTNYDNSKTVRAFNINKGKPFIYQMTCEDFTNTFKIQCIK